MKAQQDTTVYILGGGRVVKEEYRTSKYRDMGWLLVSRTIPRNGCLTHGIHINLPHNYQISTRSHELSSQNLTCTLMVLWLGENVSEPQNTFIFLLKLIFKKEGTESDSLR